MANRQWLIYDERAHALGNTDDANVIVCEDSEKKAMHAPEPGYVWRYDVTADNELINEHYVGPNLALQRLQKTATPGGR